MSEWKKPASRIGNNQALFRAFNRRKLGIKARHPVQESYIYTLWVPGIRISGLSRMRLNCVDFEEELEVDIHIARGVDEATHVHIVV